MKNKIVYAVLVLSLGFNLFFGGIYIGRKLNPHRHASFCGKVSEEIKAMHKEKMAAIIPLIKDGAAIRLELKQELANDPLNLPKVKELFTKQTESFITVQRQAQESLLDIVTRLPKDERGKALCLTRGLQRLDGGNGQKGKTHEGHPLSGHPGRD